MDQDDARWRITGVLRIVVAIIAAIGLIEVVGGFLGGRGSGPVAYGAAPDSQPAAGSGHKEFTERQYRAALLQFNKQTLGNWYERKGRKGAKWDAKARAFLDAMAVRFTNAGASPAVWTVGKTDAELRTMGKAAMDAGCDDPLVEYSMSVLFLDQGASAEAKTWTYKCVDGIQQSPGGNYPPVRLTFAAHRAYAFLPSHDAEREKYWGIFADSALNACRAAKGIERRIICSMLWNTLSSDPHPRVEQWCRRLDGDGQVDPWLKDVFTGLVEINAAWDARGTGFANTVAQQGWEGFYAHLEEAQKRLKSAWQREPTYPESATAMISVAMGGGDRLNEDPRAWLDKALSAQIDYLQAIEAYFYSQPPRNL